MAEADRHPETRDVWPRALLLFAAGLLAFIMLAALALKLIFGPVPYPELPGAADTGNAASPALQRFPEADLAAFRKALLTSEIPTVRGKFKFGANQHPVQDWYALTAEKGADGKMVLKTEKKVLTDHGDVYASECKMAKD